MNKFILIAVSSAAISTARAQDAASTPASSPDMDELRQQVKALTETVKELQQQVKDQQAIKKTNGSEASSSPSSRQRQRAEAGTTNWCF